MEEAEPLKGHIFSLDIKNLWHEKTFTVSPSTDYRHSLDD